MGAEGVLLAAKERGGLALILPDIAELVWGAVSFAIVLFVLSKVALPKVRETIEARENRIQRANEDAESARAQAEKELEEYKKQLAEARADANRIIEEGRQQAEQVRKDLIARAEQEASSVVARAQEQIAAERTRTIQELQSTIADFSIELAEKVVKRSVDGSVQRDLVDAYIKEVAGLKENGKAT